MAATAAFAFVTFSCGRPSDQQQTSPATAAQPSTASQPATALKAGVAGRLAPAVAPPATLVVLEPTGAESVPVKAEPAIMDQGGYEFLPGFLTAQVGQAVQFRNSEDVLHNVRVTETREQKPVFNVATVAFGFYEHKFEQTGFYAVTCDIHPTMRATILVTATPYTATTDADGGFTIANVPPGQYTLTAYGGAAPIVRSIEVKDGRTDLGVIQ